MISVSVAFSCLPLPGVRTITGFSRLKTNKTITSRRHHMTDVMSMYQLCGGPRRTTLLKRLLLLVGCFDGSWRMPVRQASRGKGASASLWKRNNNCNPPTSDLNSGPSPCELSLRLLALLPLARSMRMLFSSHSFNSGSSPCELSATSHSFTAGQVQADALLFSCF